MTLKQLQNNISIGVCLRGQFKVAVNYRNKIYHYTCSVTSIYDRIKSKEWHDDKASIYGYTLKQAYRALWDECKADNELK